MKALLLAAGGAFALALAAFGAWYFLPGESRELTDTPQDLVEALQETLDPPESILLSVSEGDAPLSVRIEGPDDLLARIEACTYSSSWFGASGNGLSVDWGDGRVEPVYSEERAGESCSGVAQEHVYASPGTYAIRARLWHPGPTDEPITDWEGRAEVRVRGEAAAPALELLSPEGGERVAYQRLPPIKWNLSAGGKGDLLIELIDEEGRTLSSRREENVAYDGAGTLAYLPTTVPEYDEAVRDGEEELRVRVSFAREDGASVTRTSEPFVASAEWSSGKLSMRPLEGEAPLAVTLTYMSYYPSCDSYAIDWGDGSAMTLKTIPLEKKFTCPLVSEAAKFTHTYAKPGTYRVTFRTGFVVKGEREDVSAQVPYETVTVRAE